MTIFWVGQRVRIVNAHSSLHLLGKEATVISSLAEVIDSNTRLPYQGYAISIDGIGPESPIDGLPWCAKPHQLEPILPEGLESREKIEELWEPQGEPTYTQIRKGWHTVWDAETRPARKD